MKILYSSKELFQNKIYDIKIVKQLKQNKKEIQKTQNFYNPKKPSLCKECGKEISRNTKTGLCDSCYKKTTRIVNRPYREELKDMIRKLSFTEIGRRYGVSDNTIRK